MNNNKTIGLIGGNSSFAGAYFYKLLLDKAARDFGAKENDDFPQVIVDCRPVADFISKETNKGVALSSLKDSLSKLGKYDPMVVVILCNTIHLLYGDLLPFSKRLISLVEVTSAEVVRRGYKKVGVLATPTTIKHDLYGKVLRKSGVEVVYPGAKLQKYHEKMIRKVIAGDATANNLGKQMGEFAKKNDLDGVVLGCTELPLIFPKNKFKNVVDCLDVLADKLLLQYYEGRKHD